MDKIEELLPGIEEFLTHTLASESLSSFAEERRQFFIERLDIVKLPPTLPPREGRVLPPDLLKETEQNSGIPVSHSAPDFAATQREISRSLVDSNPYQDDEADGADNSSEKGVKVYDDIDPEDVCNKDDVVRSRPSSEIIIRPTSNSEDEDDHDDENDLYEIPVARQQLQAEENSLSYGADGSSLATAGSTEELPDDVLDSTVMAPPPVPPPLPPRRDIRFSDSGSKNSLDLEDKPPELPFRPALPPPPKRGEVYTRSDKSDKSEKSVNSDPDLSGDGDSTSYESFEEDNEQHEAELVNKYDVKLPKKPKKKSTLKKSKKLSKSRSSSQWEISVPFRKLDNIDISGELYHRGKLSWNRRIVAISNGCLAMYKPDKDARPMLVIPLTGYDATVSEREGRKAFEIKMTHPNDDSHTFSVDFREWANLWMEHIKGTSRGQPPPKYHTHLARSFSGTPEANPATYGSKNDLTGSNSNVSTGSEGGGSEDNSKAKIRGSKVMRMGSFAFRATQFFENIGKKSTTKRKSSQSSSHPNVRHSAGEYTDVCNGIVEESSISSSNSTGNITKNVLTPTSDVSFPSVFGDSSSSLPTTPMTDLESPLALLPGNNGIGFSDEEAFAGVAHKGYLSIFSSFNKRRWGKRWCMVRENMFECYRKEGSRQCELNFLLRPCVLRRAIAETNSELGLMIMEEGKEKITVEPLSVEEMGPWVRILLLETSTSPVPEGLEEYMKEPEKCEGDNTSVMSFSVLKQWDMGSLVPNKSGFSHDYEDPLETASAAAKLSSSDGNISEHINNNDVAKSLSDSHLDDNVTADTTLTQSMLTPEEDEAAAPVVVDAETNGGTKFPRISDNLAAYNKNKHTTDSGFYSVKGANSDSDSSCENSSRDVGELDCGYATLDSRSVHPSQSSADANQEGRNSISPSKDSTGAESGKSNNHITKSVSSSSSQCVQISHSSSSSFSSKSEKSMQITSESHSSVTVCTASSQNCAVDCVSHDRDSTSGSSTNPPGHSELMQRHSSSVSTNSKSCSSVSSTNTIISPSGEEYSMVLKRSERSSKSPEADGQSRVGGKLEDNVFQENNDDDLDDFASELTESLANHDTESHYEPIGQFSSSDSNTQNNTKQQSSHVEIHVTHANSSEDQQQPQPSSVMPSTLALDMNSSLDSEKHSCDSPVSISGKLEHDASCTSSLGGDSSDHADSCDAQSGANNLRLSMTKDCDDGNNDDAPPPIPTSPVPELTCSSLSSSSKNKEEKTASDSSQTENPAFVSSSSPSSSSNQEMTSSGGKSKGSKKKGKKSASEKDNPSLSLSLPLTNGETSSSSTGSLKPDDTSKSDLPLTPTTDKVNAMVENPDTTAEELKEVIDRLKIKQGEIKRKRMAVHNKRQRVLSDEERLACEKEFAALEKTGENVDADIRILQNQLDFLQGQTLEAMKAAQGKRKPGSRKKKKKKT